MKNLIFLILHSPPTEEDIFLQKDAAKLLNPVESNFETCYLSSDTYKNEMINILVANILDTQDKFDSGISYDFLSPNYETISEAGFPASYGAEFAISPREISFGSPAGQCVTEDFFQFPINMSYCSSPNNHLASDNVYQSSNSNTEIEAPPTDEFCQCPSEMSFCSTPREHLASDVSSYSPSYSNMFGIPSASDDFLFSPCEIPPGTPVGQVVHEQFFRVPNKVSYYSSTSKDHLAPGNVYQSSTFNSVLESHRTKEFQRRKDIPSVGEISPNSSKDVSVVCDVSPYDIFCSSKTLNADGIANSAKKKHTKEILSSGEISSNSNKDGSVTVCDVRSPNAILCSSKILNADSIANSVKARHRKKIQSPSEISPNSSKDVSVVCEINACGIFPSNKTLNADGISNSAKKRRKKELLSSGEISLNSSKDSSVVVFDVSHNNILCSSKTLNADSIANSVKNRRMNEMPEVRMPWKNTFHPHAKRGSRKSNKKDRKKVLNKAAATRYRIKKTIEKQEIMSEIDHLECNGQELQQKHDSLLGEIKYLKSSMREMLQRRGLL